MNEKITTERIIELMMEKTGRDRATVQTFVGELTALVSDSLIQDGSTRIKGIGKFRIVPVKERESVNPAGERIVIPAHHWLSFLPDKFLKDRINKPFASFEAIEAGEGDAPIEQPEDAEREYVDDDDTPTDEVPLSAPTPDNVQKDKPEAPEENVLPIVTAHEVADVDDVDDTEEKVEPVTLIGSEWNNENQHTMNREIKKEIAEGWWAATHTLLLNVRRRTSKHRRSSLLKWPKKPMSRWSIRRGKTNRIQPEKRQQP